MRVKREYRTTSKANYNRFKASNPSVKVTYADYQKIIKECNRMYFTEALETGDKVYLPFGFGQIAVHKYKRKQKKIDENGIERVNLAVDYHQSRLEGVTIYNMNFHSSGYNFKWKLFMNSLRLIQNDVWVMRPSRIMSRTLAKYIFKDKYYSQLYKNW